MRCTPLLLLVAACHTAKPAPEAAGRPALAEVVKIFDAESGARLELPAVLDALAREEVVFLGETHLDESTHRLELAVYEGLIERTGGKVVLARPREVILKTMSTLGLDKVFKFAESVDDAVSGLKSA